MGKELQTKNYEGAIERIKTAIETAGSIPELWRQRDMALALQAAAHIAKRKDVEVQASLLVRRAERFYNKYRPELPKGRPTKKVPSGGTVSDPTPKRTRHAIKMSHEPLTDEEYSDAEKQSIESGEPLTRKAIRAVADEKRKLAKKAERKKEAVKAERRLAKKVQRVDIHHCSCAELSGKVEAGSLDAIFTDPPYLKEYIECWSELGDFAMDVLKPGGLLLTLSGQMFMPDIMNRLLRSGLTYRWMAAIVYRAPQQNYHASKISNGWKPVLAFRKDGELPKHYSEDMFHATPRSGADKKDHEWGQSLEDMKSVAKEWLRPGWHVADPFCGAGSLLAAAKSMRCHVIGCDVDAMHVETTIAKLESLDG